MLIWKIIHFSVVLLVKQILNMDHNILAQMQNLRGHPREESKPVLSQR